MFHYWGIIWPSLFLYARKMAVAKQKSLSIKQRVDILKAVGKSAGQCGSKGRIMKFGIASLTLSTVIKDRQKMQAAFEQADFEPERK